MKGGAYSTVMNSTYARLPVTTLVTPPGPVHGFQASWGATCWCIAGVISVFSCTTVCSELQAQGPDLRQCYNQASNVATFVIFVVAS